jgi:hypothetical protein
MAKYRKKPVVIEAEQWFPIQQHKENLGEDELGVVYLSDEKGRIETLEGTMTVRPGDWIIVGIAGEKYPCKPDIFEQTYELVK